MDPRSFGALPPEMAFPMKLMMSFSMVVMLLTAGAPKRLVASAVRSSPRLAPPSTLVTFAGGINPRYVSMSATV